MRRLFFVFLTVLICLPITSSVETFGESGSTLPEITNISVYDVSGLSGDTRYTDGELVTYGINTTLNISQQTSTEYRINITIVNNQGDEPWVLNASDDLYHEGLDTGWTVNEIFYDITGDSRRFGGSVSNGNVTWDTGNGGEVATDERMVAAYLVEIDNTQSQTYDAFARVSDTNTDGADESGSSDDHRLDVTKVGTVDISLLEPPNSSIVQQNYTFTVNGSVSCSDGECGTITTEPRYGSTTADTVIPDGSGEPFYTTDGNQDTCASGLGRGETCYSSFTVNATGDLETEWWLDIQAESSYASLGTVDGPDHNVTIDAAVFFDLDFTEVGFGTPDPGTDNVSAQRNGAGYNITVADNSRPVDGLWVKGQPLVHTDNTNYAIDPGNVSITDNKQEKNQLRLSQTYKRWKQGLARSSVTTAFFFLDVPVGMLKGTYEGAMTFKANTTQ